MANMSYCRFSNTLSDLRDCYDNWDADNLSEWEQKAMVELINLCQRIADEHSLEETSND